MNAFGRTSVVLNHLVVLLLLRATTTLAQEENALALPFGLDVGDELLDPSEDGASPAYLLPSPMDFFGDNVTQWYMNTNGVLSFRTAFNDESSMDAFPDINAPGLVAAYWMDLTTVTSDESEPSEQWARTSTQVEDLEAASVIVSGHPDGASFTPEVAAVATWNRVQSVVDSEDSKSSFQATLAYSASQTWIILSYSRLDFSGALIGFNGIDGTLGQTIGRISNNQDTAMLLSGTNCNLPGTYVYEISDGPFLGDHNLPIPFGAEAGDMLLEGEDDGHSGPLALPQPMNFFGNSMTQYIVNTNGIISFDRPYLARTPDFVLPSTRVPAIVAGYWTDLELGPQNSELWAGTSTDASVLASAASIVSGHPDGASFEPEVIVRATWNRFAAFGSTDRSTFQVVLAYNGAETWVILAYGRLGETLFAALVGLNSRDGMDGRTVRSVEGDFDRGDLVSDTNCGLAGVYAYNVTRELVATVSPGPTPSPSTAVSEPPVLDGPPSEPLSLAMPFGETSGDILLDVADDASSDAFSLPAPMTFFGDNVTMWYMSTNGLVSFLTPFTNPDPSSAFPDTLTPGVIAGYWMDLITLGNTTDGNEQWARTSTAAVDLDAASMIINGHPDGTSFSPDVVAVATWYRVEDVGDVGPSGQSSFQVSLAYSGTDTWVILSYAQLEFSGALIGFNGIDGTLGETVAFVDSDQDIESLLAGTNCGISGTYVYEISDGPFLGNETVALPFGEEVGDLLLPGADDGASTRTSLPKPMNFYGSIMTAFFVNTNGIVSFDRRYVRANADFILPSTRVPAIVAGYWTDLESEPEGSQIWAGTSTEASDLTIASSIVNGHPEGASFVADTLVRATWFEVAAFNSDARSTFQVVLAYNDDETWAILSYGQLGFTLFGALVGFNSRDGMDGETLATIEGDRGRGLLISETNCDLPGVYAYNVTRELVSTESPTLAPTGSTSPNVVPPPPAESDAPSDQPSDMPSSQPSKPAPSPSEEPTARQIAAPTIAPTVTTPEPTDDPVSSPTASPTPSSSGFGRSGLISLLMAGLVCSILSL